MIGVFLEETWPVSILGLYSRRSTCMVTDFFRVRLGYLKAVLPNRSESMAQESKGDGALPVHIVVAVSKSNLSVLEETVQSSIDILAMLSQLLGGHKHAVGTSPVLDLVPVRAKWESVQRTVTDAELQSAKAHLLSKQLYPHECELAYLQGQQRAWLDIFKFLQAQISDTLGLL